MPPDSAVAANATVTTAPTLVTDVPPAPPRMRQRRRGHHHGDAEAAACDTDPAERRLAPREWASDYSDSALPAVRARE